jgi:hypothetical protein
MAARPVNGQRWVRRRQYTPREACGAGIVIAQAPAASLLIDQQTRVVLGQVAVVGATAGKGTEIHAFDVLSRRLDRLDLPALVIAADARHDQRGHVEHLCS